jgi:hypothetical protein
MAKAKSTKKSAPPTQARKAASKAKAKAKTKSKAKAKRARRTQPHLVHHADGTLWAKGQTRDGVLFGYWEWFRKDGTMLRSGTFGSDGEPTGTWTTYDRKGKAHKVTELP